MNILNKLSDVEQLEEAGIQEEIVRYLGQEWLKMYEAFSESESLDDFEISLHCQMVFLKSSKDDLTILGLPSTLSKCSVEYVELVDAGGGNEIYRTFILEDNEAGIMLYPIVNSLDSKTEEFLAEKTELNAR